MELAARTIRTTARIVQGSRRFSLKKTLHCDSSQRILFIQPYRITDLEQYYEKLERLS